MELKELQRYYLRNNAIKELEIYHKKEIGLGIALVKFEEFQKTFIYAQHSFNMGMSEDHKVIGGDGNNERAKKEYQFCHLRHAILDYNACYDLILQIVYFGCNFFDEIKSQEDYNKNLKKCTWTNTKENDGFKDRVNELIQTRNDEFKVFLKELRKFYGHKDNNNYPLASWANQLKHRGGFIIDELEERHIEVTILNEKTRETVFSSDYIKPIRVSFLNIEDCLVYHNDKIVEYVESLYKSLGLDDLVNFKKKFSAINTTDWVIQCKL